MSSPSGGRQRSKTFSNDDNGGEAVSMSMAKLENNQGDSKKTIGSVFIPIATGSGFRLKGAPYDFISLGKPLLSFSYGPQVATHSSLAGCRKYIFDYAKYDDKQLENYLKKMISNPYEAYSSFRDRIRESEFDVWKNFALEAFSA